MKTLFTYICLLVSTVFAYANAESFSAKDAMARKNVEAKIALANAQTTHITELERLDAEIESLKTILARLNELKKIRQERLAGLSKTNADVDKKLSVDETYLQKIDVMLNGFYKQILSKGGLNLLSFDEFSKKSPNEKFRYVASTLLKMRELDVQLTKNSNTIIQTGAYQKASVDVAENLLKLEEMEGK